MKLTDGGSRADRSDPPSSDLGGAGVTPSADSAGAPAGTGGQPTADPHVALTPSQLDKLRLRELRMLRRYARRQADKRLSSTEREAAARQIAALKREAERRLRAQSRRELAAREQLAREKARAKAPPPPPPRAPTRSSTPTPAPAKKPQPKRQSTNDDGTPRNKDEADKTCLLDEDSGQYICPQ
jgi:hypothetical protein